MLSRLNGMDLMLGNGEVVLAAHETHRLQLTYSTGETVYTDRYVYQRHADPGLLRVSAVARSWLEHGEPPSEGD